MAKTFFEDLAIGSGFGGQRYRVPEDEMIEFARKWDPRPIHLDDEAGQAAGFGGIIASGAYTTAIFTLLGMRSREADGEHAVIAGLGARQKLPRPVRGGDVLEYRAEIAGKRESKSRPDAGVLETRAWLCNQDDEVVLEATVVTLVSRRPRTERAAVARLAEDGVDVAGCERDRIGIEGSEDPANQRGGS